MNELITNVKNIEEMIYEIRGKQVMLDSDLARLYKCKNGTKSLNLSVKRHINRFPERYMFQLTKTEFNNLRFQTETANKNMSRVLPYAFTEEGVAMLSAILRTTVAEEISIKIMDAFVAMRKYIATNNYVQRLNIIETKVIEHDNKFDVIFSKLENEKNNHIFFKDKFMMRTLY